jgi:hypothetical protein
MEKLVQHLRKKIDGVSELFTLDASRGWTTCSSKRMWRSFKARGHYLKGYAASLRGLRFTITGAHIRRSASARQWRCGAKAAPVD